METSATVRLIEGVRLIQVSLYSKERHNDTGGLADRPDAKSLLFQLCAGHFLRLDQTRKPETAPEKPQAPRVPASLFLTSSCPILDVLKSLVPSPHTRVSMSPSPCPRLTFIHIRAVARAEFKVDFLALVEFCL